MFVLATAFLVAITAELAVTSEAGAQERYWPPGEWRTASPESQGIDSDGLAAALEFIDSEALDIHSLQILRNGYLVLDAFFYPYSGNEQLYDPGDLRKRWANARGGRPDRIFRPGDLGACDGRRLRPLTPPGRACSAGA